MDGEAKELISVCRIIFGYLHQAWMTHTHTPMYFNTQTVTHMKSFFTHAIQLAEARAHNQESSDMPISEEPGDVLVIPE